MIENTAPKTELSRRQFILAGLSLSAAMALGSRPAYAQAARIVGFDGNSASPGSQLTGAPSIIPDPGSNFWSQPRVLRLRHARTGERYEASYWRNGQLDPNGYAQACHFLRDDRAKQSIAMDPRLLDLLCAMQAWVSYYGFSKPFVITSAYRTARTNNRLEGAARNSMHLRGKAVDIVFPDLPVNYMGQLAQHYSAGGVGFYPSSGFVHVDTGNVRAWRRG